MIKRWLIWMLALSLLLPAAVAEDTVESNLSDGARQLMENLVNHASESPGIPMLLWMLGADLYEGDDPLLQNAAAATVPAQTAEELGWVDGRMPVEDSGYVLLLPEGHVALPGSSLAERGVSLYGMYFPDAYRAKFLACVRPDTSFAEWALSDGCVYEFVTDVSVVGIDASKATGASQQALYDYSQEHGTSRAGAGAEQYVGPLAQDDGGYDFAYNKIFSFCGRELACMVDLSVVPGELNLSVIGGIKLFLPKKGSDAWGYYLHVDLFRMFEDYDPDGSLMAALRSGDVNGLMELIQPDVEALLAQILTVE